MAEPIKQIQVGSTNYNIRGYFYGTCDTTFDVDAKVVVCPEFTSSDLTEGTLIVVNFNDMIDTDESDWATLNVNSTGALPLYRLYNSNYDRDLYYSSKCTLLCVYGIYNSAGCWIILGPSVDRNNTYSTPIVDKIQGWTINRYASCSTGASTAAKTASVSNGTVTLAASLAVYVKFTNANTANNPTLNINSKGAKNIFYNGAQITTGSEKSLLKGLCLFVYDGTQWHLIPSSAGPSSTVPSHTHSINTTSTNTGAASGSTANSTAFNTGTATPSFTGTAGNTSNTSVTPAGIVTGSLSGTVLTLGFSGTAANHSHPFTPAGTVSAHSHSVGAHSHGLNSHTHTYDKATDTGTPQ